MTSKNNATNNDKNGKRKRKTWKQRYCKMSSEFRQIVALNIDDLKNAPCIAFGQRVDQPSMPSSASTSTPPRSVD
jgi:hypothetical protein